MPTVTKIINFDYNDVKNVILTQNATEAGYGNIAIMNRVSGKRNEYYYDRLSDSENVYNYIFLSSDENIDLENPSFTKLARISDFVFDQYIKTLEFKYDIIDSEIEFNIEEIQFNLDGQYSNIGKHNESHVVHEESSSNDWNIHFNRDVTVNSIDYDSDESSITTEGNYNNEIKFIQTPTEFGIDNYDMKLNTLTTYFSDSGLVLGCLYKSNDDYYYLIKYSNPSGRNRCIKLPKELGEEYEVSGIFQLIEVFDNIIICTGNNLYTYNIDKTNYIPEASGETSRSNVDSIYSSSIFNLYDQITSNSVIVSNFRKTIETQVSESEEETETDKLENFYAFYLPMDIDYCRLFFAMKLNTYNCYEFHVGNLLAIYNLDDLDEENLDNQLHYIHSSNPESKSTLAYEEFMAQVINDLPNEGTEYGNNQVSLINDTSPYTNYLSLSSEISDIDQIRSDEIHLLTELYSTLKHGVNCTNGHGDLLAKFKYFRVLESGLCKFTKNTKDELIIIIYSNVLTNLKKYILKLGYINANNEIDTLELSDIDNIYVQLSNEKFVINWLNSGEVYSTRRVLDITDLQFEQDRVILRKDNNSKFYMLYKDSEFTVDSKLDVSNVDSGSN